MQKRGCRAGLGGVALLVALAGANGCAGHDDGEESQPPRAVRAVAYDVHDTTQAGQLSSFNGKPGGGSVGMPLKFGDINGDGHGDFIACPMLTDSGPDSERRDSGEIHIYFGDGTIGGVVVNTPDAPNITTFMGARAGDLLGNEAFVADFNRDGYDDLLLAAQNYDGLDGDRHNCGGVFLYYGRAQNPRTIDLAEPPADMMVITGADAGDRLGLWAIAGDVDGDGALDLLLGADQADGPANDRPDAGAIYILFGGQPWPTIVDMANPGSLRISVIHGIDPGDHFGSTILAVDVNHDGAADILAAAGLARGSSQIDGTFKAGADGPNNDRPDAGEVYVLFSEQPFPAVIDLASQSPADRITMYGAGPSDVAGEELAAGDLDGDGAVDLAIGSLQAPGPDGLNGARGRATGRSYVVFNANARRGAEIDFADPGPGVTTLFGRRSGTISGDTLIVADTDEDGIDDLWDAAPALGTRDIDGNFRPASGALDVVFGQRQWPSVIDFLFPPPDLRHVEFYGGDANDQFSYGMTVGDANGDGHLDLILNSMSGDGFMNQVRDAGEFYVLANDVLFDTTATAQAPLYLNVDIQPYFERCRPCHAGDNPAANLSLDIVQHSITSLFGDDESGRQSTQVDDLLVRPNDPDHSYLIEKLQGQPRVGDPMPPPPAAPLPDSAIAEIRRWINEGARIANEDLPPPPPPPQAAGEGFSTTFFARIRLVLADAALGQIEVQLLDPPGPIPLRIIGPRLTIPASEFNPIHLPETDFGAVDIDLREDAHGTIDRQTGAIELSVNFVMIALDGAIEVRVPAALTTGSAAGGPFTTEGKPYNFVGGTVKLAGVGTIPPNTDIVGGDRVLVELEGSINPLIPATPTLTAEIQPILTTSCALVNCHTGDGAGALNLDAGSSFSEIVNVPSSQVTDLRVKPGDPPLSYLFEKIISDRPRVGDRMPIGNVLDPLDVEAIRQWIAGGAEN